MKICTKCKQEKSEDQFYRDRQKCDGRHSSCKTCDNNRRPFTEEQKVQRRKNSRRHGLRKWYGLTVAEYELMHSNQLGRCAICDEPETRLRKGKSQMLSVDHNHKTGKTRALLCHRCNLSLGLFEDNIFLFKSAIQYLENHN